MKPCSLLLVCCLVLFCSGQVAAQASQGHVYEDSSILYSPEEINPPVEEVQVPLSTTEDVTDDVTDDDEDEDSYIIDTSLYVNKNRLYPDSISSLKNTKGFAYAKNLDSLLKDYQQKEEQKKTKTVSQGTSWIALFFTSMITQVILWGLAVFFIGFIVYKLFFTGGFFQRNTATINRKATGEDNESPLTTNNYDSLIATAKKAGNYRLATRYLYLQLLQKLTASGAIVFAADKTNSEYIRELAGKPYQQQVAGLTLNYEYVWYGEFAIDAAAYSTLETRFNNLKV